MPSLDIRVAKLEALTETREYPAFDEFVSRLPPLDEAGEFDLQESEWRDAVPPWLQGRDTDRFSRLTDPAERGLAKLLADFEHSREPFAFERYRGRVSARILAALYSERRNWAWAADTVRRVRELAGVIDAAGNVMPGYVLAPNGCILDALTAERPAGMPS